MNPCTEYAVGEEAAAQPPSRKTINKIGKEKLFI
jgi:hypothetical protein